MAPYLGTSGSHHSEYSDVCKHYYDHVEHIKYEFNIVKDEKILITEEGTNLNMPDDSMLGYVLVWSKK